MGVFSKIDYWATRAADAPAYLDGRGKLLTYAELRDQLGARRAKLMGAGLAGKRLGILTQEPYELGLSVLAVGGIATAAPLNGDLPLSALRAEVERLQLDAVCTSVPFSDCGVPVLAFQGEAGWVDWNETAAAILLSTSGSSGASKCVALHHSHLAAATDSIARVLELAPTDRAWGLMPLFHIHGLSSLMATLTTGGSFLASGLPEPHRAGEILEKLAPTWFTCSPALHQQLLDSFTSRPRHKLRFVRSASGPASLTLLQRVEQFYKVPFVEAYGMTEAAPQISSNGLRPEDRRAGSVGRPAGPEVRIVEGEIQVKGANVAFPGWLSTGDLGAFDEDGFLFVTGRKKDFINRGGEKISPRDVELQAALYPAVKEVLAYPVPDELWGESVGLAVVLQTSLERLESRDLKELERGLRDFLSRRLSPRALPQTIEFLAELPTTPSGKLSRRSLAEERVVRTRENGLTAGLDELWIEALDLERVDEDDHFFHLGGHSLRALSMLFRLEQGWGCKMSLADLLRNPTFAQFVQFVGEELRPASGLSTPQETIWIACQDRALAPLYNVSASLELQGEVQLNVLSIALDLLLGSLPNVWVACRRKGDVPVFEALEPVSVRLEPEPYTEAALQRQLSEPFQLEEGPLVRTALFRKSDAEYTLCLVFHHLICDGWSAELVRAELIRLYGELRESRTPTSLLSASLEPGPSSQRGREHWKSVLAGFRPPPFGRPRDLQQGAFERIELRLTGSEWSAVSKVADEYGVTNYIFLMAALQMALKEETGHPDISVSSPFANRTRPEDARVVGMFARVLPIRTKLAKDDSLQLAVEKVARAVSAALEHQDFPLQELLKEVGIPSPHSVMFAFQSYSERAIYQAEGLTARTLRDRATGSKFSLSLYLIEDEDELRGSWHFHSSALRSEEVESLARRFRSFLGPANLRPSGLLGRWAEQVALRQTADAVVEEGRIWSYAELDFASDKVASFLLSHKVRAGEVVALLLPRGGGFLAAVLGVWKAGAAFLPLSPEHPAARVAQHSEQFGAAFLLDVARLEEALAHPGPSSFGPVSGELAYVMPTSGSTGRPKGVEITHKNLDSYIQALNTRLEIDETDRYLHTAAFTFSSSVRQWFLPLSVGGTVVLANETARRDPERLLSFTRDNQVSVLDLVPTHWRALVSLGQLNLPGIRKALSASEPLPSELARRILGELPEATFVSMYGQTETSGIVCTMELDETDLEPKLAPLGRPLPSVHLSANGERSEMVVKGPTVGLGYRGSRRFEGSYLTGDRVSCDVNGVWHFEGRLDRQLKVRGHRVEPSEVEHALELHPSVRAAAVALVDNRLHAFLEGERLPAATEIRKFLSASLADYQIPSTFSSVSQLPRTESGKLARSSLQTDSEESRLCEIWGEALNLVEVRPQDNYFHLGGDSLLALKVVELSRAAGIPLTLDKLFQLQTVRKICADLRGRSLNGKESEISRVELEPLRRFCIAALEKAGLPTGGAALLTDVQLEQSLKGLPTHNVADIPRYVERLQTGLLNKNPQIAVVRKSRGCALLDGDNGPGQWVASEAIALAIEQAEEFGVGLVSVRNSNHFGAAGHYAWLAARQNMIALVTTNGPAILAPTGGVTPLFGNNPIAVGIPRGEQPPLVLDMALSVAPRGKIGLSVQEGRSLQPGWILDALGRPTTDLQDLAAGLGVPIGAHKGYGLALMMEVLAGVLSGAEFGLGHGRRRLKEEKQQANIGHFFLVFKTEMFTEPEAFQSRLSCLLDQIYSSQKADGVDRIFVPGEMEWEARRKNLALGVPIRSSNYRLLSEFAEREGLSEMWPLPKR